VSFQPPPENEGRYAAHLWLLQRLSALLLLGLVGVHLAAIHYLAGAGLSYGAVAARLASPSWRLIEEATLLLAVFHAMNGLWTIGEDYLRNAALKRALLTALIVLGCGLSLAGTYILVFFSAAAG
jgi:succinate dehydrogenase hydrophobic membrane anchor protein